MYLYSAALYDLMRPNLEYESAAENLLRLIAEHRPGACSLYGMLTATVPKDAC